MDVAGGGRGGLLASGVVPRSGCSFCSIVELSPRILFLWKGERWIGVGVDASHAQVKFVAERAHALLSIV